MTAPAGLSRPPTAFIGSWCQGSLRLTYKTVLHRDTRCPRALSKSQQTAKSHSTLEQHTATQAVCSTGCDRRPKQQAKLVPSGPNRVLNDLPAAPGPFHAPRPKAEEEPVLGDPAVARTISPVSPPLSPSAGIRGSRVLTR